MPGVFHSTGECGRKQVKNWLKNALFAGFFAVSCGQAAEPEATPTPSHAHGVHGMVLFGEPGRVFASHLPLYRHPHDWQVVLELAPADEPGQQQVNALLAAGGLLTLEPERFDLWRLKPGASDPMNQFKAALYRGHFERGGKKLDEIVWQVKRTLVFEPVRIAFSPDAGHRYFQIGVEGDGHGGRFWLLHKVERVPDTDQVVEICTAEAPEPGLFKSASLLAPSREDLANCAANPLWRVRILWQDSDDLQ